MTGKPFPQSYWVHEKLLCAGHYPGAPDVAGRDAKLRGLLDCGIRQVISLMEETETGHAGEPFEPYIPRLLELAGERKSTVDCHRIPIRDAGVPTRAMMKQILDRIDASLKNGIATYLHCWGGHGRTGTVVACHLIRRGQSAKDSIQAVGGLRRGLPKAHPPFEGDQTEFILSWTSGE